MCSFNKQIFCRLFFRNLISFFWFFIISIFVFVLKDIKFKFRVKICSFSINNLFAIFDIYCLIYFSNNFFHLFKLKNDIDDLIRKGKRVKFISYDELEKQYAQIIAQQDFQTVII